MDEIIDTTAEAAKELGEIGKNLLETGATFIGPAIVAGVIYLGVEKMFEGFED